MNEQERQLRIGLVTPFTWYSRWGVNRHVRGLAVALEEMGHEVSLIVPAEERERNRKSRQRVRLAKKLARDQARTGSTLAVPAPEAETSLRLLKIPGTFHVPYSEYLANLALPLEVTEHLNQLLANESFDILHVHEPYPPSLSFTALRLAHCPVMATFHTAGERFLSYQLMRAVVERFFSRLDGRVCTTEHTRRIVSGYFPGGYEVIPAGVDTRRFRPPESKPDGRPLFLFAAWGEPRRSLALLYRTLRLLPDDVPEFDLAIVGGDPRLRSGRMTVPRRLRDRVTFTGYVGGRELPDYYARAEALCAPYAAPGLSTAVLEAMASGVAVLLPGQGGIRELIQEGAEGFLLDHPYSYSLAAGIMDLLDNPVLRRSLGAAAAKKATSRSWRNISEKIAGAYYRAHGRRSPRPYHKAIIAPDRNERILADLHTHTSHSPDCSTSPEALLAACRESGIEAVAITDHNTIAGGLAATAVGQKDVHVIVGEEVKTVEGEIIGLYLSQEIPRGLTVEETIARIRGQGGLVYVPHPFDPLHTTPSYETLARNAADIDIIEVYNPRITFTAFNERARKLARKYDIPGGAGSDCHVLEGVGTAMLSLARFHSPAELLISLRQADIIRSTKSPLYLHSMKLLRNSRASAGRRG